MQLPFHRLLYLYIEYSVNPEILYTNYKFKFWSNLITADLRDHGNSRSRKQA